jgi:hypothetical protein
MVTSCSGYIPGIMPEPRFSFFRIPEVSAVHWFISEETHSFLLFLGKKSREFAGVHSDTILVGSVKVLTAVSIA